MSEESKAPDTDGDASPKEGEAGPVDNVVDEILETVGGMNAMLEALEKSRPHLQEAGKVFLTALARATEEARHTAEASAGAAAGGEDPASKRGAELAAKLFGAIDKVARAAAPDPDKDATAAEFEDAAATRPSELGERLAGALDHALGVAARKLEREAKAGEHSADESADSDADGPHAAGPSRPPEAD